jgi:L-threonylcarbamoyladenylate synthase
MIIDGGPTLIGVESTVADATSDEVVILRPGGVTREMLMGVVNLGREDNAELRLRSPGNRHRHYAPSIPVLLWESGDDAVFGRVAGSKWCYMGVSEPPKDVSPEIIRLYASVDDYARELFSALREFERSGRGVIVAELPPPAGVGEAVRNRLTRAASAEEGQ